MKQLVHGDQVIDFESFPYASPKWQYGAKGLSREFLDSLLYCFGDVEMFDNPPDGFCYVRDMDGLKEWYAQLKDYYLLSGDPYGECPEGDVYDYLNAELGRYVVPVKGVRA